MVKNEINTSIASLQLENNIVKMTLTTDREYEISDVKEIFNAIKKLNPDKKALLLADISFIKNVKREVRQYASYGGADILKATAIITKTPLSKVVGNFFIGLNRMTTPVQLFSTEKDAINWLNKIDEK